MEQKNKTESNKEKNWFDKYYKVFLVIPIIIVLLSMGYIYYFYSQTGEILMRDVSLSGGTIITINIEQQAINVETLEQELKLEYEDINFRKLTDLRTNKNLAIIVESSSEPNQLRASIEKIIGFSLTEENSSTEFTGSSLSSNFYKQLMFALLASFILMSLVIFLLFRTFIPSIAVIFAAFADIVIPLAIVDYFGIRLSAAGIAAFLMLIGYSVDTDILLTTRAIKTHEGTLNSRIFGAFKTGILMTTTALFAVLPAFFLITGLPDSFRQIFLILAIGLFADIFNTWLTNVGIIKWYCESKGIE
ncbi:MAG: protein translocase subunit SecF [archaeon]|nr:protein translocase subunit SecF [archaeon]